MIPTTFRAVFLWPTFSTSCPFLENLWRWMTIDGILDNEPCCPGCGPAPRPGVRGQWPTPSLDWFRFPGSGSRHRCLFSLAHHLPQRRSRQALGCHCPIGRPPGWRAVTPSPVLLSADWCTACGVCPLRRSRLLWLHLTARCTSAWSSSLGSPLVRHRSSKLRVGSLGLAWACVPLLDTLLVLTWVGAWLETWTLSSARTL